MSAAEERTPPAGLGQGRTTSRRSSTFVASIIERRAPASVNLGACDPATKGAGEGQPGDLMQAELPGRSTVGLPLLATPGGHKGAPSRRGMIDEHVGNEPDVRGKERIERKVKGRKRLRRPCP